MTNSNFPLNLTEFDLASYEYATKELNKPESEAFEIAVKVAEQDNSEFVSIDDLDLTKEERE